jgi:hypothetical protein
MKLDIGKNMFACFAVCVIYIYIFLVDQNPWSDAMSAAKKQSNAEGLGETR